MEALFLTETVVKFMATLCVNFDGNKLASNFIWLK